MKKTLLLSCLFSISISLFSQNQPVLFGVYDSGNIEKSILINASSKALTELDSLPNVVATAQGESSYDMVHERYFTKTSNKIISIDAISGELLDSFDNALNLCGIEYDTASGKLFCTYWNGTAQVFASLDPDSHKLKNISTLSGVIGTVQGENTFDSKNSRYFFWNNLGITIVNAKTGAILDNIVNSNNVGAMEYDSDSGRICGVYLNGSVWKFVHLNLNTKTFKDVKSIPGMTYSIQGEATFDPENRKLYYECNMGITVLDANTGNLIDTIKPQYLIHNIEYLQMDYLGTKSYKNTTAKVTIFPNPVLPFSNIHVSGAPNNSTMEIWSSQGTLIGTYCIQNEMVNLQGIKLSDGIYYAIIRDQSHVVLRSRILVGN